MNIELEWKYETNYGTMEEIQQAFSGEYRKISMETTYFDTPERNFSSRNWTLRHRMENDRGVCTLKTPAEGGGRKEYEAESKNLLQGVSALLKQGAPKELGQWGRAAAPVCSASFTRQALTLDVNGTIVELALDQGVLRGGEKFLPLSEIEVEFKSGDTMVARAFAMGLAARYGLRKQPLSKFARAFQLAEES